MQTLEVNVLFVLVNEFCLYHFFLANKYKVKFMIDCVMIVAEYDKAALIA
jgi:hypothetical protein